MVAVFMISLVIGITVYSISEMMAISASDKPAETACAIRSNHASAYCLTKVN